MRDLHSVNRKLNTTFTERSQKYCRNVRDQNDPTPSATAWRPKTKSCIFVNVRRKIWNIEWPLKLLFPSRPLQQSFTSPPELVYLSLSLERFRPLSLKVFGLGALKLSPGTSWKALPFCSRREYMFSLGQDPEAWALRFIIIHSLPRSSLTLQVFSWRKLRPTRSFLWALLRFHSLRLGSWLNWAPHGTSEGIGNQLSRYLLLDLIKWKNTKSRSALAFLFVSFGN